MTFQKRLDRSRDVGQICPPLVHPTVDGCVAHFEQNGLFFDHEGLLLEPFLTEAQKKQAGETKKADGGGESKADATTKKPPKAAKTRTEKRETEPAKKQSGSDDLNLEAWLRGEEVYPEFRVKKVVRDRYNRVFNNINDLVQFLVVDESLVHRDVLKDDFRKLITPASE